MENCSLTCMFCLFTFPVFCSVMMKRVYGTRHIVTGLLLKKIFNFGLRVECYRKNVHFFDGV